MNPRLTVHDRGRDIRVHVGRDGAGYLRIIAHDHSGVCVSPPRLTPEEARMLAAMLDNAATAEDQN